MRVGAPTQSCPNTGIAELSPRVVVAHRQAGRGAGEDAEDRALRNLPPSVKPWLKLVPAPAIHSHDVAFAAFAAPDGDRLVCKVEVARLERERFADSQSGTPEHDEQRAQTHSGQLGGQTGAQRLAARVQEHHKVLNCERMRRVGARFRCWRASGLGAREGYWAA